MRRLVHRTTAVWRKEEGFSLLLALLVGSLFVAPLVKEAFPGLAAVTAGLSYLLFVVGALVVSRTARGALAVSVLAGAAIALEIVHQVDSTDPFVAWRLGAACLVFGVFALATLARVFAAGPVTSHRLVGAVVAYLLVGVTWAHAYGLIEALRQGSFRAADGSSEAYPRFLYYSFVTLTTVGYGDITPVSSAARALSNIESLVGILFPAILIGRLLSKQGAGVPPEPPASTAL
jgi:hypothetical protein